MHHILTVDFFDYFIVEDNSDPIGISPKRTIDISLQIQSVFRTGDVMFLIVSGC